ncbi:Gp19/Gp15/Gp42 family protein [Kocuria rosea]|uniref:Gp19/Gp15/Gp42 family protein n=1 Tax=Kocuria rosea TaxID=1275 RepID=UPI003D33007C
MAEFFGTIYGNAEDLGKTWRPLTTEETAAATALLPVVSELFRARVPGLDDLVDTGPVHRGLVAFAAQQVVKRVLMNPEGFKQVSEGTGPFTGSATYDQSIAGVNLYISDSDIRLFHPSYGSSFNLGTIRIRPGLGMA